MVPRTASSSSISLPPKPYRHSSNRGKTLRKRGEALPKGGACSSCHERKVKCSGGTVCQACLRTAKFEQREAVPCKYHGPVCRSKMTSRRSTGSPELGSKESSVEVEDEAARAVYSALLAGSPTSSLATLPDAFSSTFTSAVFNVAPPALDTTLTWMASWTDSQWTGTDSPLSTYTDAQSRSGSFSSLSPASYEEPASPWSTYSDTGAGLPELWLDAAYPASLDAQLHIVEATDPLMDPFSFLLEEWKPEVQEEKDVEDVVVPAEPTTQPEPVVLGGIWERWAFV